MNCVYIYQKVDTCKSTGGHAGSPGRTSEKWEASWIGHCRGIWAGAALSNEDEEVSDCWGIATEVLKEAGELNMEVSPYVVQSTVSTADGKHATRVNAAVVICESEHWISLKKPRNFSQKASGNFEQAGSDSPGRVWAPRGTVSLLSPLQLPPLNFCCFAPRWVGTVVLLPSVPAVLPASP